MKRTVLDEKQLHFFDFHYCWFKNKIFQNVWLFFFFFSNWRSIISENARLPRIAFGFQLLLLRSSFSAESGPGRTSLSKVRLGVGGRRGSWGQWSGQEILGCGCGRYCTLSALYSCIRLTWDSRSPPQLRCISSIYFLFDEIWPKGTSSSGNGAWQNWRQKCLILRPPTFRTSFHDGLNFLKKYGKC